jgi:hypothetical protein
MDVMRSIGGVELPDYFGKMVDTDEPAKDPRPAPEDTAGKKHGATAPGPDGNGTGPATPRD